MKKKFTHIRTIVIALSLVFTIIPMSPVSALNVFQNCPGGNVCGAAQTDDFQVMMHNIVNTLLLVLGMIAVIMIVIGGIRYTTSNGDASQVKAAKDTVLYSVVGLVVAILAYAIVNFVIGAFN